MVRSICFLLIRTAVLSFNSTIYLGKRLFIDYIHFTKFDFFAIFCALKVIGKTNLPITFVVKNNPTIV